MTAVGAVIAFWGLRKAKMRLELSLAKHRSLGGHPRIARRIAAQLPSYQYEPAAALAVDGAGDETVARRHAALERLKGEFRRRYPASVQATLEMTQGVSDMQFIGQYRVPFQFRKLMADGPKIASFMQSSSGVHLTDLDGNEFFDLTGSYGVNLFGNDFYKRCMQEGVALVHDLGPVLGSYHPVVQDNVTRLQKISGMDEVSFHMSGTEAVMQAVRLARYHTGRMKIVRFSGAYNGWWGDVQPGIGNPVPARDTLTLTEMGEATLHVLRTRKDIACILINPLQGMHPNKAAPSDGALLSSARSAGFDRDAYTNWLKTLRNICDARGIALILDEVFVGFRIAAGGAQEYFGVRADFVTYGKTLGGGLPVGVVCGRHAWMKRFRDDRPADICFARGTFNAHPHVMGAMNVFLRRLEDSDIASLYVGLDARWNQRAATMNARLKAAGVPVQVVNFSSIWTVVYEQPGCFNWLYQHYLRLEGIALSWVGSGRLIFSLNYNDEDFEQVVQRFERAAIAMQTDGWWLVASQLSNKSITRRVLRELVQARL
jgi:glutamate-1-semialdehyde 2,1-aminomutase